MKTIVAAEEISGQFRLVRTYFAAEFAGEGSTYYSPGELVYLSLDNSTQNISDYDARLVLKLRMHELGFFDIEFFAAPRKKKNKLRKIQKRILHMIGGPAIEDLTDDERKSLGNNNICSYTLAG
ncbi:MAG TPA: hypothetical protein VJG30_01030 [Candidatus Nanoarchaeia archaeon]|nr:hypothetical protein [Candidatus Nanoarchaeia archaeon]